MHRRACAPPRRPPPRLKAAGGEAGLRALSLARPRGRSRLESLRRSPLESRCSRSVRARAVDSAALFHIQRSRKTCRRVRFHPGLTRLTKPTLVPVRGMRNHSFEGSRGYRTWVQTIRLARGPDQWVGGRRSIAQPVDEGRPTDSAGAPAQWRATAS